MYIKIYIGAIVLKKEKRALFNLKLFLWLYLSLRLLYIIAAKIGGDLGAKNIIITE